MIKVFDETYPLPTDRSCLPLILRPHLKRATIGQEVCHGKAARRFSKEVKQEAFQMARGADLSISQVSTDLGIHANVLNRWCREQEWYGSKAFRGQGVPRDGEMARLKRELARVKRERDFLKDAAVFFARDTPRNML